MDFVTELIGKLENSRVLARERDKRPSRPRRVKQRTTRSRRGYGKDTYTPTGLAKAYARRRSYDATIAGQWHHLARMCRAKRKGLLEKAEQYGALGDEVTKEIYLARADNWRFEISLDRWVLTWLSCRDIIQVEGQGIYAVQKTVPAWKARGRKKNDVQLKRLDLSKPWTPENVVVTHREEIIGRFKKD